MVILISSITIDPKYDIVTTSPTSIMEYIDGYIPLKAQVFQEVEKIPVIPSGKLHVDRTGPSGTTWDNE